MCLPRSRCVCLQFRKYYYYLTKLYLTRARLGCVPGGSAILSAMYGTRHCRQNCLAAGQHGRHDGMSDPQPPPIRYRLGLNQPAHSPTARRMAEMADAIARDTEGAFQLEVH